MSWFIGLQVLGCLLAGGLLARSLSEHIRGLVVRLMPLEKRISEDSFHIQARTSTIIAAALALFLSGLLFWGLEYTKQTLGFSPLFQSSMQYTVLPAAPDLSTRIEASEPLPTTYSAAPVIHEGPSTTAPVVTPPAPDTSFIQIVAVYYLQVGAYDQLTNARAEAHRLEAQHPGLVQVLKFPYSTGPHKVLLGPFPARQAATNYRRLKRLHGFVRKHQR